MKLMNKDTKQIFITNSESTIKAMLKSNKYEKVDKKIDEQIDEQKTNSNEETKSSFSKGNINDR